MRGAARREDRSARGCERRAVARLRNARRAQPVEPVGETLGERAEGMCCAITVGGQFSGKRGEYRDQRLDAAGRGADGDDLAVRLVVPELAARGLSTLSLRREGPHFGEMRTRRRPRFSPWPAGRRTSLLRPDVGLGDAIDRADLERALMVASVPWLVRLETMITGVGRRRMIFSRKSMPFMFGISTSSVTTSGSSAFIASRASKASRSRGRPPRSRCRELRALQIKLRMVENRRR